MSKSQIYSIKILGPAGTGVKSSGENFLKTFVNAGYYAFAYTEYPSLIKGGHNTYLITLRDDNTPINSENINLLLPFTKDALIKEQKNITADTLVICDESIEPNFKINHLHRFPFKKIAAEEGNTLMQNTVILGFLSHQLSLNSSYLLQQIKQRLSKKKDSILKQNETSFQKGIELSKKHHLKQTLPKKTNTSTLILNGNQAIALGAIASGINFYAGYPMTPSTPLLQFLAKHQEKFGFVVHHTEDEISAINMALGASFTGAKSMTATASGGFALMQESISLAGMLELPIVIMLAQRTGPATGLPTWTSQTDLLFAVHSGHGEFPKIVIAPSDTEEAYKLTHEAFEMSQKYHSPVIILTDKYLLESSFSTNNLPQLNPVLLSSVSAPPTHADNLYSRYQVTPTGIKSRTLPGMENGEYIANSDEHNEFGLVNESATNRTLQNTRRVHRMLFIKDNMPDPDITPRQDTALISWGSTKHIVAQVALENNFTHIHFTHLWPLPNNLIQTLEQYQKIIVIENNLTAQFARLIQSETATCIHQTIGNDTGRPLTVTEINKQLLI